jgi:hypothetical protein
MSLQRRIYFALIGLSFLVTIIAIYYLLAEWRGRNSTVLIGVQRGVIARRWSVRYVDVELMTEPSLFSRRAELFIMPHLFGPDDKENGSTPFKVRLFISNNASCWEGAPNEPLKANATNAGNDLTTIYTITFITKDRNWVACDVDLSAADDFVRRSIAFEYWDDPSDYLLTGVVMPRLSLGPWVPLVIRPPMEVALEDNFRVLYNSHDLPKEAGSNSAEGVRMIEGRHAGPGLVFYQWDDDRAARVKDALLLIVGGFFGLLCSVVLEVTERMGKVQ